MALPGSIFKKQISATTPRIQRILLRLMKSSLRTEYLPCSINQSIGHFVACLPNAQANRCRRWTRTKHWRHGAFGCCVVSGIRQVAQLSQRDRAAGWVKAKSWRMELGDNIYGQYVGLYLTTATYLASEEIEIGEQKRKIRAITLF